MKMAFTRKKVFRRKRTMRKPKKSFRRSKSASRTKATTNVVKYTVGRQLPMPPRFITKFVMNGTGVGGAGNVPATYIIYANGLQYSLSTSSVLPGLGISASSHQPTGKSFLLNGNTYTQYRVFASQLSFKVLPSALTDQFEVVTYPYIQANGTTSVEQSISVPYAKRRTYTAGSYTKPIINKISMPKLFGVRPSAYKDDVSENYCATYGANPSYSSLWAIAIKDTLGGANAWAYEFAVTYWVECFNLSTTDITQS